MSRIPGANIHACTESGGCGQPEPRLSTCRANQGTIVVTTAAPTATVCQPRDGADDDAGCRARNAQRAASAGIAGST